MYVIYVTVQIIESFCYVGHVKIVEQVIVKLRPRLRWQQCALVAIDWVKSNGRSTVFGCLKLPPVDFSCKKDWSDSVYVELGGYISVAATAKFPICTLVHSSTEG